MGKKFVRIYTARVFDKELVDAIDKAIKGSGLSVGDFIQNAVLEYGFQEFKKTECSLKWADEGNFPDGEVQLKLFRNFQNDRLEGFRKLSEIYERSNVDTCIFEVKKEGLKNA